MGEKNKHISSLELFDTPSYPLERKMHPDLVKEMEGWPADDQYEPQEEVCTGCYCLSLCLSPFLGTITVERYLTEKLFTSSMSKEDKACVEQCDITELTVPIRDGNDREIKMRMYRPKNMSKDAKAPAMVCFFGGGHYMGSLDSEAYHQAKIAVQSDIVVLAGNYGLLPERPYPGIFLDSYCCVKHVCENASELGVDANRIMLQGSSAGGGHVHSVVAQMALKEESHLIRLAHTHIPALYGWFYETDYKEMSRPERLEKNSLSKIMNWMCGSEVEFQRLLKERDPILFPDLASDDLVKKMCPFIITDTEHDQFLRSSNRFASRLKDHGLLLENVVYPECGHMQVHPDQLDQFFEMIDAYLKG